MARKPHPSREKFPAPISVVTPPADSLSRRGKKCVIAGMGVVAGGFWILTYTDPAGQNWASTLSPFLLVAGYALIGVGIMAKDS